jgi:ketosteroid isomerase-like protein
MSLAEGNKALVRRFLEAHAKGDLDTLEAMLAPDFVNHTLLPGQEPARMTREGYLRATTEYHAAVSNASVHFEDQVAAGEKVVTR